MDLINNIFRKRKANKSKLSAYGFSEEGGTYVYRTVLPGSGFSMEVDLARDGLITATVIDPQTREPYTLHLSDRATGRFVTGVKLEYEQVLTDIAETCFEPDVFKSTQTKGIIAHVRETYGFPQKAGAPFR